MVTSHITDPLVSQLEVIVQSFSDAAQTGQDITAKTYAAYFERCPGSDELMAHTDHRMRGRMMEEVLKLLMAEDLSSLGDYLRFETKTHEGYGVEPVMYHNLLLAVRDTVRELLGNGWGHDYERSWDGRIEYLAEHISSALLDNEITASQFYS